MIVKRLRASGYKTSQRLYTGRENSLFHSTNFPNNCPFDGLSPSQNPHQKNIIFLMKNIYVQYIYREVMLATSSKLFSGESHLFNL